MRNRFRLVLTLCAVVAAAPGAARAGTSESTPEPRAAVTLRLELPYFFADLLSLGGVASVRFLNLLEAELGATYCWRHLRPRGPSITARLGIAPELPLPRIAGTGWKARVPLLAGYTYYPQEEDYTDDQRRIHVLTGAAGLDATFWRRLGFNVRLLGFAGVMYEVGDSYHGPERAFVWGVICAIGVGIPL